MPSVSLKSGSRNKSGVLEDTSGFEKTVYRSFINATNSGNTQIVAAQGEGIRIRVLSMTIVCLTALSVKFQSGTTDIFAELPFGANGGIAIPFNQHGIFQTELNEDRKSVV